MNAEVALFWMQQSIEVSLMLTAPLLGVGLVVGLMVSMFQAVTSMQEMTLSYIPKIAAVGSVIFFFSSWMLQMLVDFTVRVFQFLPNVAQ